jgi:glycosyltransferase involved in cell wall biosynthesis
MKLLAIARHLPAPDRASGDLRFFQILKILAREHQVTLVAYEASDQRAELGEDVVARHRSVLHDHGVSVVEDRLLPVLRKAPFDATLFEFYHACRRWVDQVRFEQPNTRIVVDSVDCHFLRLQRRANTTGRSEDADLARKERVLELDAYSRADMVLAVTEEDRTTLAGELPGKLLAVVPNIHSMPLLSQPLKKAPNSIVFVGGFKHDPNVDAVRFFCREILPAIRAQVPAGRFLIVGSDPPAGVRQLADEHVEVMGYVSNLAPVLEAATVSVAPLRYGAGQKGKIGEAMSYALPVVMTSVGAEGFGLEHGTHGIVADRPHEFAAAVIRLLKTPELRQRIGSQARALIDRKFSDSALCSSILDTFESVLRIRPARLPRSRRLRMASALAFERNVGWRLRKWKPV